MGTQRFRGAGYSRLLSRLPRNLVVFDGHCLLCQARVRFVLERNFSFFHFRSMLTEDTAAAAARLERHALHFASLDSSEGRELLQRFFTPSTGTRGNTPAWWTRRSGLAPLPDDVAVLLLEKVPSANWLFLRHRAGRTAGDKGDDVLWRNSTVLQDKKTRKLAESLKLDENPLHTDLVVSVNFAAMCRIGMHLDRFLLRSIFRLLYYVTPDRLGSWWFRKFVSQRRHQLWGTSAEDAVDVLGRVEGMKERRWSCRTVYKNTQRVNR